MDQPNVAKPAVYVWFLVFCLLMALMYLGCTIFGGVLLSLDPAQLEGMSRHGDPNGVWFQGLFMLILGLPLFLFYAGVPFLPPRKWSWVLGIVAIALSLTSCCCMPAGIPLLIFWLKSETKAYYGWV